MVEDLKMSDERNCGQASLPGVNVTVLRKITGGGASATRMNFLPEDEKNKEK